MPAVIVTGALLVRGDIRLPYFVIPSRVRTKA
jgi:hypothetical protein